MLGPLQNKQKQTRRFVAFSAKRKLILMSTYITPPPGGRDIDTLFRTCFFPILWEKVKLLSDLVFEVPLFRVTKNEVTNKERNRL